MIEVSKTADPATVPAGGGDVEFTVSVTGTGTGFFNSVDVIDEMAGCTLEGPFGDQDGGAGADKLEQDETWTYTCTVEDVEPGTENEVSAFGCHDQSEPCAGEHDATDVASVTVGLGSAPTDPPTDTQSAGAPGSAGSAWLLIVALGALLASIVVFAPMRRIRQR